MIRLATKDDYNALDKMCFEFWEHAPYDVAYKAGSAINTFDLCLSQGLLFVAEINQEIIGFTAGIAVPLLGNMDVLHGTELAWWVAPEHRGGTAGIKLLKRLESAAKEKGCVYWSMAFMETSMPSVVKKMYEKLNYELKETSYGKRL
jgi:GNAT superfamily N-acetyltransferase